ncbi:hypothetical protein [Kitasatospora terrestris]|uniref:Uncharacterized protein n=1 Tax=Kitasatospora terrestris TaxID=258051 RepID=A0ABP9EMB3_9ACTN
MAADDSAAGYGGEPTPAELRDLQARADALTRDIAAMRSRLTAQSHLPRNLRSALPESVDRGLARASQRLSAAADGLARVRAAQWLGACTTGWGICPHCGLTLQAEDDRSWCEACGTAWDYDRSQGPCGERGVYLAMDELGGTVLVCAAHGRYLSERLDGGLLLAIPEL